MYVDRDMWEKIVLNLLSNAFKFTFEGGISLSLSAADGMAELCVRDTGAGIGPRDLPRVFERFHRVSGAAGRTHEGAGIGLALVQDLVKLHGGSVTAESAPARGSVFTVTIPFGRAHLPQERIAASPKPASVAGGEAYVEEALRWLPDLKPRQAEYDEARQGPRARILLADDNADMREYVSQLLRTRYQVDAVADGAAALAAATANPPDLVLSDVMMPVLSGLDLLAALRSNSCTKTVPVILVSARAGESSTVEGLEAGADDYLVKPFSARELMARVAANLNLARLRDETRQRIGVIIESVTDAFLAVDRDWNLTYMNTHAEKFACAPVSGHTGLIGTSLWEAFPAALGTEFEIQLRRAAAEKTAIHFEAAFGKENCWAQVNAYPSPDGGLAVSFRDVSEQKRFEQQLRDTAKLESLGVLAGGIAHDFNNLLVGIMGNASLAMELLPTTHPAAPLVSDVLNAGEAAANLTRQMLAYSGKGRFVIRLANLSELIGRNVTLIHASIPKNVTLSLQLEADLPAIRVDEAQIQQLVMNLVINAAEACGDRPGAVSILTAVCEMTEDDVQKMNMPEPVAPGHYVRLEVSDTGEGMDESTQARIFDPFFSTKFTGRGLGLAAVMGIVRGHKGAIRLISSPGAGTTFQLFFPPKRRRDSAC